MKSPLKKPPRPIGREFYCYWCETYIPVTADQPPMEKQEVLTCGPEDESGFVEMSISKYVWHAKCPHCQAWFNCEDPPPLRPEEKHQEFLDSLSGPPCPRCQGPLISDKTATCHLCGFNWYKCPNCGTPWERGEQLCGNCSKDIKAMAKIP